MIDCVGDRKRSHNSIHGPTRSVDWDSQTWGQAGHNVHESATGSWLEAEGVSER